MSELSDVRKLLRRIQQDAVESKAPIGDLLRRCKILAARLEHGDLADWIENELNGYSASAELPNYRQLTVHSKGNLTGMGRTLRHTPIPASCLPKELRHRAEDAANHQPIGALEDLLTREAVPEFQSAWSPDLIAIVQHDIYEGMTLLQAWQVIPRGAVIGIVETVRNRILSLALDLEKRLPTEEPKEPGQPLLEPRTVSDVYNTIIQGHVTNLSIASQNISQEADISAGGERE